MEFTILEKRAVIKVLSDVMLADGEIDPGERAYLGQIFNVLKISEQDTKEIVLMSVSESIAILGQMDDAKKEGLSIMMVEMIEADNDINNREMEIFAAVFAGAGISLSLPGEV